MKTRAKSNVALERREILSTGGGKAVIPDDDLTSVSALVSSQIKPLKNKFDCDAGTDDDSDCDSVTCEIAAAGNQPIEVEGGVREVEGPASCIASCSDEMANIRKQALINDQIHSRQEEEHSLRMKMIQQQIDFDREEHDIKMECLNLKKRSTHVYRRLKKNRQSSQTSTKSYKASLFNIDLLID